MEGPRRLDFRLASEIMVRAAGLEPARKKISGDFKSPAPADYAMPAG